jgi:hypothetical protein
LRESYPVLSMSNSPPERLRAPPVSAPVTFNNPALTESVSPIVSEALV